MNKVLTYIKQNKKFFFFLLGSVALFVIDIVSKWIVEKNCNLYERNELIPNFLYITKSYNVAIAFSLGEQLGVAGRVINIIISLVMSVAISWYWIKKQAKMRIFDHVITMMLLAGAVGNLIDRAFYWEGTTGFNGVIDFIQFYLGGGPNSPSNFINPFATFNFADSYLVIGVIMLLVWLIVDSNKSKKGTKDDLTQDPRDFVEEETPVAEENNEQESH